MDNSSTALDLIINQAENLNWLDNPPILLPTTPSETSSSTHMLAGKVHTLHPHYPADIPFSSPMVVDSTELTQKTQLFNSLTRLNSSPTPLNQNQHYLFIHFLYS
jgi:hypothetical protein